MRDMRDELSTVPMRDMRDELSTVPMRGKRDELSTVPGPPGQRWQHARWRVLTRNGHK